jgi:hypothetical protein
VISKPRKGRYFPLSPAKVKHLTEEWLSYVWDGQRRAGTISFLNPSGECDQGIPLVHLDSPSSLEIFSLPGDLDPGIGLFAQEQALAICGPLARTWKPAVGNIWQSYLVYLAELGTLVVTERRVRFKPKKYRTGQKFSRNFKPALGSAEETEVRRVSIAV